MPQRKIRLVPHGVATIPISELASALSNWRTQTDFPGPKDWVFASPVAAGRLPYWPDAYRVNRYVQGENADADDVHYAAGLGLSPTCESEVVAQLVDLQQRAIEYARKDGDVAVERFFNAQQNAHVVRDRFARRL